MRFQIEQVFATDPTTLCRALVDPSYLTQAMGRLPDITAPTIESHRYDPDSDTVRQALMYSFNGSLPAAVTRIVSPGRLNWIEDTTVDVKAKTAIFRITPVHYARFFSCQGTWRIVGRPEGCARQLDGNLKVNSPIPFVGGQVEKAIVSGLRERLEKEPDAFDWWIGRAT